MTINRDPGQIDEDRGLLAAARLGDERAFGRLIEHHRRGLELYCELMLGCPDPDLSPGCRNQISAAVTTMTPTTAATAVRTSLRLRGGR